MTHSVFRHLSYEEQLVAILDGGNFLAQRWATPDRISLYHFGSFFVELYYDTHAGQIACVRNFRNALPLGAYVDWIQLPTMLE